MLAGIAEPLVQVRVELRGISNMSVSAQQIRPTEMDGVNLGSPIDQALLRLKKSIESVEAVLHGRDQARKSVKVLEDELQVLFQDRARLANELDRVKARAAKLDAVSAEVAGRLDVVTADIGSILGGR